MLVEVLKSFGLSEYEAKALLALLSRGTLTAKEIAEIAKIPRTSVYDVMNSLISKGLVEAFGKPLKFKALRSEEIVGILSKRVEKNIEILRRELPKFESEEVEEVRVYRNETVIEKISFLISNARKLVILVTYIPEWLARMINESKAEKVVISSNPDEVSAKEVYKLDKEFKGKAHGLIIVDDKYVMFIFINEEKLGILSDGHSVIQFSKLLVDSLIEVIG